MLPLGCASRETQWVNAQGRFAKSLGHKAMKQDSSFKVTSSSQLQWSSSWVLLVWLIHMFQVQRGVIQEETKLLTLHFTLHTSVTTLGHLKLGPATLALHLSKSSGLLVWSPDTKSRTCPDLWSGGLELKSWIIFQGWALTQQAKPTWGEA